MRFAFVLLAACGRIGFSGGSDVDGGTAGSDAPGVIDGRPLDDAGQGDPQGRFVWTSVKFAGELAPRSRADLVEGVRGETWIAGTQIVGRSVSLTSGTPIHFASNVMTLAISGAQWQMSSPGTSITMDATWPDPDHVTLVWNPTAPGTVGTSPIEQVTMERAAIPALAPGVKTMVSAEYANGNVAAGVCVPYVTSGSRIVTGAFVVSPQLIVDTSFNFQEFITDNCTGVPSARESTGRGFLELDQAAYRLDLELDGARLATAGTLTSDSLLHVVLGTCAPAGVECNDLPRRLDLTN